MSEVAQEHADHSPARGWTDKIVVRVSLIYMITGFILFAIMGILGLIMRLDHAGWWVIDPDWFYRIMTIHGTGMVGAMLMAAMGGMSAALSRTVKLSAGWLWVSYAVYSVSVPLLLYSVLIGRFAGGWTMLDPLPYLGRTWDQRAGVIMYLSAFYIAVGFTIWCIHIFMALSKKYGGPRNALAWPVLFNYGPADKPMPQPLELSAMAASIVGFLIMAGGSAVLIPLFAEAAGFGHVDALYSKNFIMMFGHSVANITIYISGGLVYAMLPNFTRRGSHASRLVALAWNMTIILVVTPIFHHLYQDFSQPMGLHIFGQFATWTIVPEVLLITIIGSLAYVYRSGIKWNVPMILLIVGLWGWVFGGMGAAIDASMAANNLLHNTLWVPGHFHTYYLLGVTTFVWAYMYYLITELSGITEWASSRIAAWCYGISGVGFLLMFFFSGADGVPRRVAVHLPDWQIYSQIAVPFVVILTISISWLMFDAWRGVGRAWRNAGGGSAATGD